MKKFKDVEIELLTAGTVTGRNERKGVICAYVREEYADVLICLGQLKSIYRVTDDELRIWTAIKLDRLEKRLNQTQQKG